MACDKCRLIVAEAAVAIVCGVCRMVEWLAAGRGWAGVAILFVWVFHALPWPPESWMQAVVVFLLARDELTILFSYATISKNLPMCCNINVCY